MMNDDIRLDELFQAYRDSCPDVEPSPNFMPTLWQRIESRKQNFWDVFPRLARTLATVCAALCLVLLALNVASSSERRTPVPTYTDALLADHTAEKSYYTEALRPNIAEEGATQPQR